MAISFTNNWKNILDKLVGNLRTEYGASLPIYIGDSEEQSNQYIRVEPLGSSLISYSASAEIREYTVLMSYSFKNPNVKKTSLDHILRFVSRTEAVVRRDMILILADNTRAINCRLTKTELDAIEDDNLYVVTWIWKCEHQAI